MFCQAGQAYEPLDETLPKYIIDTDLYNCVSHQRVTYLREKHRGLRLNIYCYDIVIEL